MSAPIIKAIARAFARAIGFLGERDEHLVEEILTLLMDNQSHQRDFANGWTH